MDARYLRQTRIEQGFDPAKPPVNVWHAVHKESYEIWLMSAEKLAIQAIDIATANRDKVTEFSAFLGDSGLALRQFSSAQACQEPYDQFIANALFKAKHALEQGAEAAVLADDSGLRIADYQWSALAADLGLQASGAFPGVLSKRFVKALSADLDYRLAFDWLYQKGLIPNQAAFDCALALVIPYEDYYLQLCVQASLPGKLVYPAMTSQGMGYDPIFVPEGHDCCFAEMSAEEKSRCSHRGMALRCLADFLSFPGDGVSPESILK